MFVSHYSLTALAHIVPLPGRLDGSPKGMEIQHFFWRISFGHCSRAATARIVSLPVQASPPYVGTKWVLKKKKAFAATCHCRSA